MTALRFATANFTCDGYIFYGYVYTLGKKSLDLVEFAEEVRELHIYTAYLPYHPEGEIVAKIHIPSIRLEKVEKYLAVNAEAQLDNGQIPQSHMSWLNPLYSSPEDYANIRGYL